ncbi:MAG: hypothetical protein ACKPKO_51335, partial [Candidatus Fonsibacter sp.]
MNLLAVTTSTDFMMAAHHWKLWVPTLLVGTRILKRPPASVSTQSDNGRGSDIPDMFTGRLLPLWTHGFRAVCSLRFSGIGFDTVWSC